MTTYLELFCGLVVLVVAFYYYLVSNFDFWKKRGVPGPEPIPLFGTHKDLIFAKVSVGNVVEDLYMKYKHEPAVGLFNGRSPVLILHDPDVIKTVLIKDFPMFGSRPHEPHEKTEPLSLNLFFLDEVRWRPLRPKLSPLFTSGKLKGMFSLMVESSNSLDKYLDQLVSKHEIIEVREMAAKFTIDVIGSCAFGISTNSMNDDYNEFHAKGKAIFEGDLENAIRLKLRLFLPRFYDFVGFVWPEKRLSQFFAKLVMGAMKYRKENNIHRPDFIHLLMELRDHPEMVNDIELTDELLTAQAFTFFAAGFETSSAAISWCLFELAQNHDIQDKLREELKDCMEKSHGEITYETVKKLDYLDKVFKETLRKYPPGAILQRLASADYYFESLKFSIPKSTEVWIPIYPLQRDPDVFPNPSKFDPERFTKEAEATRHPMYYLPFGDGPRNCVGIRFANFEAKLGLLKILLHYKVDICEKTKLPIEFDPKTFLLSHKGGIYLKMTKAE